MKHYMKLNDEPFQMIKNGLKTVELRLYDQKRRLVQPQDIIEFTCSATGESISAEVIKTARFSDFCELYKNYDKTSLGYKSTDKADYRDMFAYYSPEQIAEYGVVAIEIKPI